MFRGSAYESSLNKYCSPGLAMFKKKQDRQAKSIRPTSSMRVDTEADFIKQQQTKISLGERCEYTEVRTPSLKLKSRDLGQVLQIVKNMLEEQLDLLLIGEPTPQSFDQLQQIQFYRIQDKSREQFIEDLGKAIQACELLYSKLRNNEQVTETLLVKDECQLLLFFKHLFGKPYAICNLPQFRKAVGTLWQHQVYNAFQPRNMAAHLRLWAAGLEFPLNPAAISLQRLVFNNPSMIKKHAMLLCNTVAYCNIDGGDCLGLTPLLVAAHCNRHQAYEQIIKSGADLFRCPLVSTKGAKTGQLTKKGNKQTIDLTYPTRQRHQFNIFQVLMQHRQFQQMVNILSLNQVHKLKKMKKSSEAINKLLRQIPDCCMQLHWRTMKGFLSFKQLPKDIITIYKKQGSLRIDYHVDNLESLQGQNGSYSILIKAQGQQGQSKLQYYLIDHRSKKIHNLMREIHADKLKLRYDQITQLGALEDMYCTRFRATTKLGQGAQSMEVAMETCYQNVTKAPLYQFKDCNAYELTLMKSDIIDYAIISKQETKCVTNPPKVKSRLAKSESTLKIEWVKEKINLTHMATIVSLIDKKSPLFLKIGCLINTILGQESLQPKYKNKLPIRTTINLGNNFSIQAEIKNLTYMSLDEAVFGLEYRTRSLNYEQEDVGMQSLQETVIMEQGYSISMSRFLGTTEKLQDLEEQDFCRRFEELLSQQIADTNQFSDEQEPRQRKSQNSPTDYLN